MSPRAARPPRPRRTADGASPRILAHGRRTFFARGFARCPLADLARDLGMSKKTLYRHFPTKEAMLEAVLAAKVAEVRTGMETILADPALDFPARLRAVMQHIVTQMGEVSPAFLHDLQRFTPALYARVEAVRGELLPRVWGRLLEEGVRRGHVRPDASPAFVADLVLAAAQALLHPDALARHRLDPPAAIDRMLTIVLTGILTPAGRKAHA